MQKETFTTYCGMCGLALGIIGIVWLLPGVPIEPKTILRSPGHTLLGIMAIPFTVIASTFFMVALGEFVWLLAAATCQLISYIGQSKNAVCMLGLTDTVVMQLLDVHVCVTAEAILTAFTVYQLLSQLGLFAHAETNWYTGELFE